MDRRRAERTTEMERNRTLDCKCVRNKNEAENGGIDQVFQKKGREECCFTWSDDAAVARAKLG